MIPGNRGQLIQYLINATNAKSYLEVGIRDGSNYNSITIEKKVSVDIDANCHATYCMSSDRFFEENKEVFDVIFIDGLHTKDQVIKDINNALKCLSHNGVIVTHDTLPSSKEYVDPGFCWNCWEAFAYFRKNREDIYMASVHTGERETGCGIITKGHQKLFEPEITDLTYEYYEKNKNILMNVSNIEDVVPNLIKSKRCFGRISPSDSGFFSTYLTAISSAWLCPLHGLIPYIDLSKTIWSDNGENPWDMWFKQDVPSKDDTIEENMPIDRRIFEHTFPANKQHLKSIREASKLYGVPKSRLINIANSIITNELKNEPFVGVHSRTTEMNIRHPHFGIHSGNNFLKITNAALQECPQLKKVFLVSEDSEVVKLFENFNSTNLVYLKGAFRRTNENFSDSWCWWINNKRPNHKRLLGEESIIQALILSKCESFVYKQSGTSSTAIIWSDGNIKKYYFLS